MLLLITTVTPLIFGLLAMALFTLLERQVLGYAQLRMGPAKASMKALLLPLADAAKLFSKTNNNSSLLNKTPFIMAPLVALMCSSMLWLIMPLLHEQGPMKNSIILVLAISSIHVYALLAMGWSSNSKYSAIGMTRGLAQTLSYEISLALIFITLLLPMKTLTLTNVMYNGFTILPAIPFIMGLWAATCLAETNRTPFDIAEGESELVSGFNTEYGGGKFALIFMAEYLAIMVMSTLTTLLFMFPGSPNMLLTLKLMSISMFALMFIGVRASLPRMRYDSLMWLTWGSLLPLALMTCIFIMPVLML